MVRYLLLFVCFLIPMSSSSWAKDVSAIPFVQQSFSENLHKEQISRLYALVAEDYGEQFYYIQLSETEFIVFISNIGIYRADLSSNTMDSEPLKRGDTEIKFSLKDNSGNNYIVLHHFYPMRRGIWGESYSLMSAKKSNLEKIVVNFMSLGPSMEYNDDIDECGSRDNVIVKAEDINDDGFPDIKVIVKQLHCGSKSSEPLIFEYLSDSNGFKPNVITK